jgi:hypothetical protein
MFVDSEEPQSWQFLKRSKNLFLIAMNACAFYGRPTARTWLPTATTALGVGLVEISVSTCHRTLSLAAENATAIKRTTPILGRNAWHAGSRFAAPNQHRSTFNGAFPHPLFSLTVRLGFLPRGANNDMKKKLTDYEEMGLDNG